jgi:hypothetical protein
VNLKKKKRSRCRLCGEQWWDIGPSFILEWASSRALSLFRTGPLTLNLTRPRRLKDARDSDLPYAPVSLRRHVRQAPGWSLDSESEHIKARPTQGASMGWVVGPHLDSERPARQGRWPAVRHPGQARLSAQWPGRIPEAHPLRPLAGSNKQRCLRA